MKKFLTVMSLILLPAGLYARWGNDCWNSGFMPGTGNWYGGHFFGGGIFMFIFTIIIFGFLVFFGYSFLKNKKIMDFKSESAFDIAKLRYAKGEITKSEFDLIKADLK
jgi:putative membrane protein